VRRVLVVIGTRPEAIKLAPVVDALQRRPGVEVDVVLTGQHRALLDDVVAFFGLPVTVDLDVMTPAQDLTDLTARVLVGVRDVLRDRAPDVVVVQGDTTTAFAASLAAFYRRIAVGHVEAGLRTGSLAEPFPEEANRRLVGVLARWHFAPTARAVAALRDTGVDPASIHLTGNTVVDALLAARSRVAGQLPAGVPAGRRLILLTTHRRESFGAPMRAVFRAVSEVVRRHDVDVVFPVHPNPAVRAAIDEALTPSDRIHLLPPVSYPEMVALLDAATLVLTDSGGLQEEAPSLHKPVLVLRDVTERPEGVEAGVAWLVGTDPDRIVAGVDRLLDETPAALTGGNPYGDGRASERIADVIVGG
jgi:UDP-N-acetylglucosamine 2-epimerase (non-hydrolysing)